MPDVALELATVNKLASLTGWNITNVRPGRDERGIDVLFEIEGRRAGAQHTTFHWDEGDIPGMRGSRARAAEERASRSMMLCPTWVKPDYRPALRRCVDKKIEKAAAHDNRDLISETWLVISVGTGRSPLSTLMLPDVLAADDLNALCHAQLAASEFECACLVLHMNRIVWGWDRPGGWRVLADPDGAERRGTRKRMSDLIFNDIAADFRARTKRPWENPAGRLPGGGTSRPRTSQPRGKPSTVKFLGSYGMPYLNWVKEPDLNFLPFETADLSSVPPIGVYVLFVVGSLDCQTVKVGFGDVATEIAADRMNQEILDFRQTGKLQVTWAQTTREQMSGIARHLSDLLQPRIIMAGLSDHPPIQTNVPGSPVILKPNR